jgi:hypothetical protein
LAVKVSELTENEFQLTASLVKPLAFPRPGGHNLALEWDIFYPLPSSWYKPTKPTKAPPKPESTTPIPEEIESWDPHGDPHSDPHDDPHSNHPGEIWVPSSGWSSDTDVIKTLSEAEENDKRRISSRTNNVNEFLREKKGATKNLFSCFQSPQQIKSTDWNENYSYRSPSLPPVTQYQNPLLYNRPWKPTQTTGEINFNQQYYQSNRRQSPSSSSYSEKNFMTDNKQRRMKFMPKGRSLDDRTEHCDRRELYRRIETTSPL